MTTRPLGLLLASALAASAFAHNPAPPDAGAAPANSAPPAPQSPRFREPPYSDQVKLADTWMRDACVLPDPTTQTYIMVASAFRGVRAYTSKDLITWEGPHMIFRTPDDFWPGVEMRGIWAPEMHRYKDKFYLFLTFDTATKFPEQWRNWLPRVRRGSQILVGDSPRGPFEPFEHKPTLPEDMMTLDGTLWIEDGVPYMVYCHEWVQIVNGTVEMIRLKDDLSATVGEPRRLFWGNDGPWAKRSDQYGCWVTDGPSLHTSKSGRLFMIWSSGSATGYATGVAISDSGKLAGPWRQQPEPLYAQDGGHGFLFKRFDGQLMMALHSPNDRNARIRLFELEDTGDTLRIVRPFPAE
jgi:arabinan endo-1,5-alpha-L-arabinosidase